MAAFRLAWRQASDGIEGDFYLTRDDQIVCIHDKDTQRTAGSKRGVETSTLSELRELEYGGWKDAKWAGEPIPTLEQVLKSVPSGKLFVIELKSTGKIASAVQKRLTAEATEGIRIMIIAFDPVTARRCKELMPHFKVHWLTSFERTFAAPGYAPTAESIARTVSELGVDGVGMKGDRKIINDEFVAKLKEGDCREFHVWTIDDADDAWYFQELGAVGITTNRPAEIGQAIRQ